uniref:Uncharacterized protein n=1 Tax=Octactis speculum TaxID=3111310 RepID=A0A7S2H0F3_9STRA
MASIRESMEQQRHSGKGVIKVTFHNDCHGYIGIMYCSDWRKGPNKVVGSGKSVQREADGMPFRVTFAARMGAYMKNGENDLLQALEFTRPGHYVVHIGGAGAQHVRLKTVEGEGVMKDDGTYVAAPPVYVDRHLFKDERALGRFMEGTVMPAPTYSYFVYT